MWQGGDNRHISVRYLSLNIPNRSFLVSFHAMLETHKPGIPTLETLETLERRFDGVAGTNSRYHHPGTPKGVTPQVEFRVLTTTPSADKVMVPKCGYLARITAKWCSPYSVHGHKHSERHVRPMTKPMFAEKGDCSLQPVRLRQSTSCSQFDV